MANRTVDLIIKLTNIEEIMRDTMESAIENNLPSSLTDNKEVIQIVKSFISEEIIPIIVGEYGSTMDVIYSPEELGGLLEFYESPVGKTYLKKLPIMNREVSRITIKAMNSLNTDEVIKRIEDKLDKN